MQTVIVVPAEPTEPVVGLDWDGQLASLQEAVGGWIEATPAGPAVFVGNEEAKILGQPINERATGLWEMLNDGPTGDTLNGTIVVTGPILDGKMTGATPVSWMFFEALADL